MTKQRRAGCLLAALIGCLALGGCMVHFFLPTQRRPELPVQQLLNRQLQVFPAGWSQSKPEVVTDTDFTWANWAVAATYRYKDGLHFATEEIHVFGNPFAAQIISSPSPASTGATKGYTPQGWTYRPLHADRFEFGCTGDNKAFPEGCGFIIRYSEYVIVFSTPVNGYMTLQDLTRVLDVIDREMDQHLQSSSLQQGTRLIPTALDQ